MVKQSIGLKIDETQHAVSQITCWCITIALHQVFGVGKTRLDRIQKRMNELENQNTQTVMTPDRYGNPQQEKARQIRESWLAGYVSSDFRVPKLRAPRGRTEQQLSIAGDTAAKITWQLYAKAVIDTLHFGPERMERLKDESRKNYDQLNRWGKEDGIDVAMNRLCRCASAALQTDDLSVAEIEDTKCVEDTEREFRQQEKEFIRRVALSNLHNSTRKPDADLLSDQAMKAKFEAALTQTFGKTPLQSAAPRR